jgi:hypothetical protein
MHKFVVERPLPNIGDATREEQLSMAKVSNEIIENLGSENIRWIESVITPDKAYCFYFARDAEVVREHSRIGGFPYDKITEVRYVLDPAGMARSDGHDHVDPD